MDHRMEMWRTLRLLVLAVAFLGGGYFLLVRPLERAASGTKTSVERGLGQVLGAITNRNTRTVEGRAEIAETKEISELSLLEMRMSATRAIEKSSSVLSFPLGTKKLIVRGDYQVKAGYKLQNGVSLHMEHGRPVATFPRPQILSVELVDFEVLSEDNGWMNKIQPEDRAQILRELRAQMRMDAQRSGMLVTVEATLRTRLRDLLGVENVTVEQALP